MIAIGAVLISDEVVSEQFVCDLNACKGGCCVEGDCGAPLTLAEKKELPQIFEAVKPYLPEAHIESVGEQGFSVWDDEFGHVTPVIPDSGICVYAFHDEMGIVKCAIEQAWRDGKITAQKPISCHLYPIRVTEQPGYEAMNYEPRPRLCAPACKLGKKLQVPVYEFLKAPLIRKYGEAFYDTLEAVATKINLDK